MSSTRRSTAGVNRRRFSPFPEERRSSRRRQAADEPTVESVAEFDEDHPIKEDHDVTAEAETEQSVVIDQDYDQIQDAIVEDDSVSLREIGSHIASQDFTSNAEIVNMTPLLTKDVWSIDVYELMSNPLGTHDLQNVLAGFAMMINRLIFENRFLMRELQALKTSGSGIGMSPFDALIFKKSNVTRQHFFDGADGIPPVCLNHLIEIFDQNCTRRNETAVNTLRRLVKFLLENIIPKSLHNKFTVRERGGGDRLIELPLELTAVIKDVCLESVNLLDARTQDDKERRNDLSEMLFRYMKFALQELRRTPRKAKIPVSRR